MITVGTPDGGIVEFPDGTSKEVMAAAMRKKFSAPAPEKPAITQTDARSMLRAGLAGGASTPEATVVRKDAEISRLAREQLDAERARRRAMLGDTGEAVAQFGESVGASAANTFGIGPRVQAGITALTGGGEYDDALKYYRQRNREQREGNLAGDLTGALIGGAGLSGVGGLALKGVTAVAPKVGNVLSSATQLQQGQKFKNAARIVGVGAGTGAAQAAGEGTDVGEGALMGGVAAGVVSGGINAARGAVRKLARPFDPRISKAIQEVVHDNPDDLIRRHADLSRRAGENVPIVAALKDSDFSRVTKDVLATHEAANEAAKTATGQKINTFMQRMEGHVKRAGQTAQRSFDRTIRNPNRTPIMDASGQPIMLPASGAIDDLVQLRDDTIDEMIEPIRNEMVDLSRLKVGEAERRLILQTGRGTAELADPIKKVLTGQGTANVTVKQLDGLRRKLNRNSEAAYNGDNPNLGDSYANAARAVRSFIEDAYPGYKPAMDVYAAHSKMLKGFETAAAGKRISDVSKSDLRRDLRTNEGRVGMMLGELHRQREAVGKSPSAAIAAARDFGSEGKLTRQANPLDPLASQPGTITENLSPTSAAELADASKAEIEVLDRMAKAGNVDLVSAGERLDLPGTLAYGAAVMTGPTFMATKANFFNRLVHGFPTKISSGVAAKLTDMLFSSDPVKTEKALQALQRIGVTKQMMRTLMVPAAAGLMSGRDNSASDEVQVPSVPTAEPTEQDAQLQQLYEAQPGLDDLAARVEQVESAGRQDAISPKGAVGVMQVMPTTAPEAAALAGVEFDDELYRTDEAYNRLLGTAYLAKMLEQFDGNQAHALAAYNAGPGAVRKALVRGRNWLSGLPAETQDYVQKILG